MHKVFKTILLLASVTALSACAGARPNITIPAQMPTPLVLKHHPRVVLVLGSGGAKGYAHIGVLKILEQAHIPIDLIVGCSAGSAIGALYADHANANEVRDIMLNAGFWDFADVSNIPSLKGPIEGYHFQKFLLKNMKARWFNQLKIPLVVATTDLHTGQSIAISSGPLPPAVEASAAIPGAVQPVALYGHTLVDGGMVDPVPVDIAKRYHPDLIIAVDVSNQLPNQLPITAVGVYNRAFLISWIQLAKVSYKQADVMIHPDVGDTGTFAIDKKWQMYAAGMQAARKALPAIRKALAAKKVARLKAVHY